MARIGSATRRGLLAALGTLLLSAPMAATAQQVRRVHRIGYISSQEGPSVSTETFRQELRNLGYFEGQNLSIQYRWTARGDRLAELVAELVALKPDLIVSLTHTVSLEVKRATTTIPVVFGNVNDPVGVGLVPNLGHPSGNVTGLSTQGLDLIAKRLELLKDLLPAASRFAYLGNPDQPYSPVYLREAQRAARVLGLKEIFSIEARADRDFDAAFAMLASRRPNALLVGPNEVNSANASRISVFAIASRLPTMLGSRGGVDAGCLASYGQDPDVHHRRLAGYVDKILKGMRPADLPVEQPTIFQLAINMKTAKALGLTIPQSILVRADRVIE